MNRIDNLSQLTVCPFPDNGTACALGLFDGVHLGHQEVLKNVLTMGKQQGLIPVVFTFQNHPQSILSPNPPLLLTSVDERINVFNTMGFEHVVALPFNEVLRDLSPEDFIHAILQKGLHIKHLSVGYDFVFGKDRSGSVETLKAAAQQEGFTLNITEPVSLNGQRVSSTEIRKMVLTGQVDEVRERLRRPFSLSGMVTSGDARGRILGFPTANLQIPSNHIVPGNGVYMGEVTVGGVNHLAVCNIGIRPTFDTGRLKQLVEIHVLDYSGPSFYDQTITMRFFRRMRDEQAFPNKEALMAQIEKDCAQARDLAFLCL